MKCYLSRGVALMAAASSLIWTPSSARATATASSQLSFTNLSITPSAGTLVFLTNWTASAFAQGGPNSQYDSGPGSRVANAAGDFSLAHGEGTAWTPFGLNVSGLASVSASIPGMTDGSDTAT